MSPQRPATPEFGHVRAVLAAFVALIATNAAVLARTAAPDQELRVLGLQHLFQAGRQLFLALVVVLLVVAARRLGLVGRRGWPVLAAVSLTIGAWTLPDELPNFASTLLPSAPIVAVIGLVLAVSGTVVAAAAFGRALARPRWRWLPIAGGLAALLVHPFVLAAGYPAAHLFMAAAAVAAIAGALVTAPLPPRWPRLAAAAPWALAAAIALFAVIVPPSNSLQVDMLRQSGDVVTPFLPKLSGGAAPVEMELPKGWAPWFTPRDEAPAVPAAQPAITGQPIVILLTIDSLRADVLGTKKHDKKLPNLAAFRDASLRFSNARAPGSQTVYTIAQMFMGKYYSQQYWVPREPSRNLWPHADESPRFPDLLAAAGVPTFNVGAIGWLINDFGVIRGFTEDQFVDPGRNHFTLTAKTFPPLLERLEKVGDGPLFAYLHLMDAHHTVRPLGRDLPTRERYILNLTAIDKRIGELVAAVERLGLKGRCYIIISSDHGEAFGEHGTFEHNTTVYDELLRVPLMIKGPGVKARPAPTAVTLMDLGPTILDIFGQPTPGTFMGQSLAGFFPGKNPRLTRPIGAEGRMKKTLIFPDGMKAIVDDKHHTAEVYNLKTDPGERVNLLDVDPRAGERITTVHKFFDIHRRKTDGYVVPYRR